MAHSYDVAMFQAALEKKTHLLPKGSQSTSTKNQPKIKEAMDSEVTLVDASSTSQVRKESSKGRQNAYSRNFYLYISPVLIGDAVSKSSG